MALHGQDLVVLLHLALVDDGQPYEALGEAVGLSASQAHAAVGRLRDSRVVSESRKVNRSALMELLVHGVKYVFPVEPGAMSRGIPTAHSALPLSEKVSDSGEPLVWPDPTGSVRGLSIEPLHRNVPKIVKHSEKLYAGLALLDGIRVGRARERKLAKDLLKELVYQ